MSVSSDRPYSLAVAPGGVVRFAGMVAVLLLTACWLWVTKGTLPPDLSEILKWGLGGYAAIRTVVTIVRCSGALVNNRP